MVQVVYTSGTTREPRGVVHRHRNIFANLSTFQQEIERSRGKLRWMQPVRILDLLPFSHMFGQSLGLYIPVLLGGAVTLSYDQSPRSIIKTVKKNSVSALVLVPRMMANLQKELERRFDFDSVADDAGSLWRRIWRHRRVHRGLGWKFWFLVVGGASVDREREEFSRRLGFVVVQGYGLTETSPVVAVNHPFRPHAGSLGKAMKGQEVKVAEDGELLVHGPSVVTEYYGSADAGPLDEDGWLHTGDIVEMDSEGRLFFKGRKKETIVTADGMKVYPADVRGGAQRSSSGQGQRGGRPDS